MNTNLITIKDLSFAYGDNIVLSHVNMSIPKGAFCAIVGANGSGKSTLLKLMLGLLKADRGSIELFSEPLHQFKAFSKIGYIAQRGLNPISGFPATVREIVALPLKRTVFAPWPQPEVDAVLKLLNIYELRKRMISTLSGGQLQRVYLAKEMILHPEILFLDEPTNGLDGESIRQLFILLETLNIQQQLTIVMVTHSSEQVKAYAKQVFAVSDQQVTEVEHA